MGCKVVLDLACGLAIAGATLVGSPLQAQSRSESNRINPFAMQLLEAHNAARDRVGVPRLTWSADLARQAQQWAEHLARVGHMVHANVTQRKGEGENLWMGAARRYSADYMVGAFVAEQRYFTDGTFPHISTTGTWEDVGHYSQVVWRNTKQVGCAVAHNRTDDFLVCRYWPAGNIYGQQAY